MATDDLQLQTIEETKNGSPTKKSRKHKRAPQAPKSNGVVENGNGSLPDSHPMRSPKSSESKKPAETTLETSIHSQTSDHHSTERTNRLHRTLTPDENSRLSNKNHVEITAVTDEDDDEFERKPANRFLDYITTDQSTTTSAMVQSFTSGDNDAVEIHEFSQGDVDAYLEIYFETLDNRLRHFIGENQPLEEFRKAMRNRLMTDRNAREYQNVLVGKINGEVVAAVTLAFPGDTPTIANANLLPQADSCFTSIRRWMLRNANYRPTDMDECYIEMIGVKNDFRNHGIGAAMLECVEHFAQQAGASQLTIHTTEDRLRDYFQRFGFALDHSDNSAIWKWIVERRNIHKMSKIIPPNDGHLNYALDQTDSYMNDSIMESERE